MCADGGKQGEGAAHPRWCGRTDKLEMQGRKGAESAKTRAYV